MGLDEVDGALQHLAGAERGKVGEYAFDCLAAANGVGDAVERYARAGDAIAAALNFDILAGGQIAHSCLQFTPRERLQHKQTPPNAKPGGG